MKFMKVSGVIAMILTVSVLAGCSSNSGTNVSNDMNSASNSETNNAEIAKEENSEKNNANSDKTKSTKNEKELKSIGNKSANAYKIKLTNKTGLDISELHIEDGEDGESTRENLLDEKFSKGESLYLYYDGTDDPSDTVYTLFAKVGGNSAEFDNFPIGKSSSVDLCYEDEIYYLKYILSSDGTLYSTKMDVAKKKLEEEESDESSEATEDFTVAEYTPKDKLKPPENFVPAGTDSDDDEDSIGSAVDADNSHARHITPDDANSDDLTESSTNNSESDNTTEYKPNPNEGCIDNGGLFD